MTRDSSLGGEIHMTRGIERLDIKGGAREESSLCLMSEESYIR